MADKSFGVKDINLIGASGTPTIESPNNININAINVAISTNATVGGSLDVDGNTELDDLNVSGVSTLGTVKISSGIVTATSGVVTYYGDGSALTGVGGATSLTDLSDATVSADFRSMGIGVDALINDDGTTNNNIAIGHSALKLVSTGFKNVAIGPGAGTSLTDGSRNILIGYNAGHLLQSNPGGTAWTVTAIGAEALENMYTSSGAPVAIGYRALREKDYGGYTVAIGGNVLGAVTQNGGNHTVAIGYGVAQYTQTTNDLSDCVLIGSMVGERLRGNHCTFVGSNIAGNTFVDGSKNTFVGSHIAKGSGDPDSDDNTAVGYRAAYNIDDSAERNTLVGSESGYNLGNSTNNVLLGYQAGYGITSGGNNIVIGSGATVSSASISNEITLGNDSITRLRIPGLQSTATDGQVLTFNSSSGLIEFQTVSGGGGGGGASDIDGLSDGRTTALSVGLGTGALANDDGTDNGNVAVGYSALNANTSGFWNVAIGKHAMGISTNANVNVFIGRDAGRVLTSGSSNAVVGSAAGYNLSSGSNNVFVGRSAGSQITDGDNNTLVGYLAGGDSTLSNSVAIGYNAGDNSSSDKATYVGNQAGYWHSGDENTFIGYRSGESDSGAANIGTGNSNTGAGYYSLNNLTSGSKNTTLGHNTGFGVTDGNSNVFLGYDAGSEQQGSENVIIGSGVTSANSATGDTQLAIGIGNTVWLRGDSSFNLYDKDGNQLNGAGGGGSGISNVVEDTTPQLGGTLETNGNLIQFGDSSGTTDDRLQFGDDQDMLMYFDGTRLKITPANSQNPSQLDFEAKDQVYIESQSNGIFLRASGNNVIDMYGGSGGGIYFHHNNNDKLKLEGGNWTTQGDADWTFSGTDYNIVFDASDSALEFADNAKAKFGAGDDLQIYHDSNNSYISDQGTGNLKVLSSTFVLRNATDNAFMLQAVANGAVKLFHNNTNRLETTGAGVTIAGIATATSFVKTGGTSSQYLMADGSVTTSGGGGGGASEAFKTIAVSGQSDVVADSATDTLTLVAGNNMTITTNASGDSITFASSGGGGGGGGVTTGKAIAMAMIFG